MKKSVTKEEIQQEIDKVNKKLSKIENIKKFFDNYEKFSIENGMLTLTLKLKDLKLCKSIKIFLKNFINLF